MNPEVIIEETKLEDLPAVAEIRRLGWLENYPNNEAGISYEAIRKQVEGENGEGIQETIDRWREGILSPASNRVNYVAKVNNEVIGWVSAKLEDGKRKLGGLYVHSKMQGKGVGTQLLTEAINWLGRDGDIYLHVVTYNEKAIKFYEHYGFKKTGVDATGEVGRLEYGKAIPEIEMVLPASKSE